MGEKHVTRFTNGRLSLSYAQLEPLFSSEWAFMKGFSNFILSFVSRGSIDSEQTAESIFALETHFVSVILNCCATARNRERGERAFSKRARERTHIHIASRAVQWNLQSNFLSSCFCIYLQY